MNKEELYALRPGERQDEYLYRIGNMKEDGIIQDTWKELTRVFNHVLRARLPEWDESSVRKRFRRLQAEPPVEFPDPPAEPSPEPDPAADAEAEVAAMSRERQLIQDIRVSQTRQMRQAARAQSLQEIMQQELRKHLVSKPELKRAPLRKPQSKALYAMLSDIHYGICFNNKAGKYDSDIAKKRVMYYAEKLCRIGVEQKLDTIYVSLMGDMISGSIHQTVRLENREDIVRQVIGASELTAGFLYELAKYFEHIYVNAVPGNHSRVDKSFDDAARGEKLDDLITWYCKTRLEQVDSIEFIDNKIDPTIGDFTIFGKHYISVHGDFDADLALSAMKISRLTKEHVDYILAGHMHVPDLRFEDTGYIRNGSVCGSGDEYTAKKRLYAPACQVCMVVSEFGVESVYPVALGEVV